MVKNQICSTMMKLLSIFLLSIPAVAAQATRQYSEYDYDVILHLTTRAFAEYAGAYAQLNTTNPEALVLNGIEVIHSESELLATLRYTTVGIRDKPPLNETSFPEFLEKLPDLEHGVELEADLITSTLSLVPLSWQLYTFDAIERQIEVLLDLVEILGSKADEAQWELIAPFWGRILNMMLDLSLLEAGGDLQARRAWAATMRGKLPA